MIERNGHTSKPARQWVADLGPDCTYEQVRDRLRAAGEHEIAEGTFASYKSELYGKRKRLKVPAVLPTVPAVIPDDRPPLGTLARLVKFGAVVESVGGIAEARRMLDALEDVAGRFGDHKGD